MHYFTGLGCSSKVIYPQIQLVIHMVITITSQMGAFGKHTFKPRAWDWYHLSLVRSSKLGHWLPLQKCTCKCHATKAWLQKTVPCTPSFGEVWSKLLWPISTSLMHTRHRCITTLEVCENSTFLLRLQSMKFPWSMYRAWTGKADSVYWFGWNYLPWQIYEYNSLFVIATPALSYKQAT